MSKWHPPNAPQKNLFTVPEAAAALGLEPEQILRMAAIGWLRLIRTAGGLTLVRSREVEDYLKRGIREGRVHIDLWPLPTPAAPPAV
jgi:excisionase family DNA binding protein